MKITAKDAVKALRAAVKVKGKDHVQSTCVNVEKVYTNEGVEFAPGCLVGTALNLLGVPLDTLVDCEGRIVTEAAPRLTEHHNIEFTPAALRIFGVAQDRQDGRLEIRNRFGDQYGTKSTWGEAVRAAVGKH